MRLFSAVGFNFQQDHTWFIHLFTMNSMMMNSSIFQDKSISGCEKHNNIPGEVPHHTLEFDRKIVNITFSPYILSFDLISIAFQTKIIIGQIKFQEEITGQIEDISYRTIDEFDIQGRVHSMCFSPETNINMAPKTLSVAYTNSLFQIYIVVSEKLKGKKNIKLLDGHRNYINGIAYDKEGQFLASCSDDQTCRVWHASEGFVSLCKFYLSSPGMAVAWNKDNSVKMLVAEKSGTITMYNISTQNTVLSLRSQESPLLSMDWSPSNSSYVSAICSGNLVIWCITNPSAPILERTVHPDGGVNVKFYPLNESRIITMGAHDNSLKIHQTNLPSIHSTSITTSLKMCTGMTCHQNLPYIFASYDNYILIWKIPA